MIKASPQYFSEKAYMEKCAETPTTACMYQIIFKNVLVGTGVSDVNFYRIRQRLDKIDRVIEQLIDANEFEVAEHYALRELAQRDIISAVGPDSDMYKMYKKAHARQKIVSSSGADTFPIFERAQGEPERSRFDKGFYGPIKDGNLKQAADFLEGYKKPRYVNNSVIAVGIREYLDALYSLGIAYAKAGDWKNAEAATLQMLDNNMINGELGLNAPANALDSKADSTFEFLDAMVGHGAGTDFRVKYIWGVVNTSKTLLANGKKDEAEVLIVKAQAAAQKLQDPSLSLSEALIFLSEGQALIGNYDKAFANADKVNELCCEAHPEAQRLMQDKRHYDNALGGIVTGAIASGNIGKAEEAADKIGGERMKAENLLEIAEAYTKSKNIDAAVKNIEDAIDIADDLKGPEEQAHIRRMAADQYLLAGKKDDSREILDKAVSDYLPKYRTMVARGDVISSPDIMPLPAIINSYVKQGRAAEVIKKLALMKDKRSDPTADILYTAVIAAAKEGDEEAVTQLLGQIVEVRKGITADVESFGVQAAANPNFKPADIEKMKAQMIEGSARRQERAEVTNNLEIAFAFAATKPDEARKYYDLFQKAHQKIASKLESDPDNRQGEDPFVHNPMFVTKKTMIEAKLANQKQLTPDQVETILLLLRATNGYDGYSFLNKMQMLLSLSDIFRDFQFVTEADQLMGLTRLMADRVSSPANYFGSRMQEQSAAYGILAAKFETLGRHPDAAAALASIADKSNRILTGGTERSIYVAQQRFLTEIIVEALGKKAPIDIDAYLQKVSLPLYRQICLAAMAVNQGKTSPETNDGLSLTEIMQDVWDDEELVHTVPPMLQLAGFQRKLNKPAAAEHTLTLANIVAKSMVGYRGVQANLLIADFFDAQAQPERQAEALKRATIEADRSRSDQKKFQAMIAQRMSAAGNGAVALAEMKKEASKTMDTCKHLSFDCATYTGGYGPDYDRVDELIPLAKSILDMEGGFTADGRKELIEWLDNTRLIRLIANMDVQSIYPECAFKNLPENMQVQVIIGGREDKPTVRIRESKIPILLVLSGSYNGATWTLDFDDGASLAGLLVGNNQKLADMDRDDFPVIKVSDNEWGRKGCGSVVFKSSRAAEANRRVDVMNAKVREFTGKDIDHIYLPTADEGKYEVTALTPEELKKKAADKKLSQSSRKVQTAYERGQEIAGILDTWEKTQKTPDMKPFNPEGRKLLDEWFAGVKAHFGQYSDKFNFTGGDGFGRCSLGDAQVCQFMSNGREDPNITFGVVDGPAYLNGNGYYFVLPGAPRPVTNKAPKLFFFDDFSCYGSGQQGYCQRHEDGG